MQFFAVQAVMSMVDNMTGPLKSVRAQMKAAEVSGGRLTAMCGALSKKLLPVAVVAGIVAGGLALAARSTFETQKALGELRSVGVTDMAALEAAGESFSDKWSGTTKAQFISAAYDIKSGISSLTDTGVAEYTRLSALTAKATKSTVDEMTSLFATGYGIYKEQYKNLNDFQFGEMFSAGIAGAVKAFKTTGSGMAQAISGLGASATVAKRPIEEQLSVLGMLQAVMSDSEAGTSYKAVVRDAAAAGKKLGLSFFDASGEMKGVAEMVDLIRGKFGELNGLEADTIKNAFSDESYKSIAYFYDKSSALTSNIQGLRAVMKGGTASVEEMAAAMNMDPGAGVAIIGQQFHNLLEVIGSAFLPILIPLFTWISRVILGLKALAKTPAGQILLRLSGIVSMAVMGFWAFVTVSYAASLASGVFTTALAGLGAAIAAISWPVWVVIGAIALLYTAWKSNFGGIRDTLTRWWQTLSTVFRGVRAVFASLSGMTGTIKGELATEIKAKGLTGLVTTVAKIVFRIRELFGGLWDAIKFGGGEIKEAFKPFLTVLAFAFKPLWDIIKSVGAAIGKLIGITSDGMSGSKVNGWRVFGEILGTVITGAVKGLIWLFSAAAAPIGVVLVLISGLVRGVIWVVESIGTLAGWIVTTFEKIADYLSGINLMESGAKIMQTLAAGIKSRLMVPVDLVKSAFARVRNLLPFSDAKEGPLSSLTLSGASIMRTLGAGIRAAAPDLTRVARGALAGVAAATVMTSVPISSPISSGAQASVPSPARADMRGNDADGSGKRSGGITIGNITIQLPNVTNANEFAASFEDALRGIVEGYDA